MKKSVLQKETAEEIIARVENLNPGSVNLWGKMNVTKMLLHCTLANKFILEDESSYHKPTFKQTVFKMIVFKLITQITRNNKGPKRLEVKGQIDSTLFDKQRQQYIDTIKRFGTHHKPFTSIHARLGYLNTDQWGIMVWMHMDHHLRQFGV